MKGFGTLTRPSLTWCSIYDTGYGLLQHGKDPSFSLHTDSFDDISTISMAMLIDLSRFSDQLTVRNLLWTVCGLAAVKFRGYLYWMIHSWRSPLRHLAGP
jgi:hypothetical protein